MIKVNSISFSYGKNRVFDDVSFELAAGEVLSVLGPNGGGKTTLLKCLNNTLTPAKGDISICGRNIASLSRADIAGKIALVPQNIETLFPFTVTETIMMADYSRKTPATGAEKSRKLDYVLNLTGIENLADRSINELSGGERQLVFVARALFQETPVLFLDEATSSLDINHTSKILRTIRNEVHRSGKSVIAVIHDINLAAVFSDRIMFLNGNDCTEPLPAAVAVNNENIIRYYGIDDSGFELSSDSFLKLKF